MSLVLSAVTAAIAGIGYYAFLKSDYNNYGWIEANAWSTEAGYTTEEWVYFLFATYFFPLSIIFLMTFALSSWHALPHSSLLKLSVYYVLLALLVAAVAGAYLLARDVLQCLSYLCVKGVDDSIVADDSLGEGTVKSAQMFVGMLYFFVAIFFFAVFAYCVACLHVMQARPLVAAERAEGDKEGLQLPDDDVLHPLFPLSMMLSASEGRGQEAGEAEPLLAAQEGRRDGVGEDKARKVGEEEQTERDQLGERSSSRSGYSRGSSKFSPSFSSTPHVFLAALLLLVLYPFLVLAACALPTWWSGFTRTGIQTYQMGERAS